MSPPTFADILELTHGMQQDLRAAQAKLVTVRSWLAAQPAEKHATWICPACHANREGPRALRSHLVNVHGWTDDKADTLVDSIERVEAA